MSAFSLPRALTVVRRSPSPARFGVVLLLALGGCSTVASWFQPAPAPTRVSTQPVTGDKPYPNLATVPNQAPPVSSPDQRKALVEGLNADRANAQYSDQALTDQPTGVAPAAPPAPAPPPASKATAAAPPAEAPPPQTAAAAPFGPSGANAATATASAAPAPAPPPPAPTKPMATQAMAEPPPPPAPARPMATQAMAEPPPPAAPPAAPPAPASAASASSAALGETATPGVAIPPIANVEGPAQATAPEAEPPPATTAATPAPAMAAAPAAPAPAAPVAPPPAQPMTAQPAVTTAASPAPVEAAPIQTAQVPAQAAPADTGPTLRNGSAVAMPGPGTPMGALPGAPVVTQTQLAAVPSPAPASSSGGPVAVDLSVLSDAGRAAPPPMTPVAPRGQPAGVIYFHNGSASLSNKDRAVLRQIARLQRQNGAVIQIIGHASMHTRNTDLERQAMVNQNISVVRASAVAGVLRQYGVRTDRIQTAAAGAQQPVFVESMPNGEAGNRRVEIYFN